MAKVNIREILTADPPTPDWVVDRFIPRDTITIMAGLEGIGKSSLSYYMALSVASGRPFLGRQTQRLKVLYFDNENSYPDMCQYVRRLWLGMEPRPELADLDPFLQIEHFSLSIGWQRAFQAHCSDFCPDLIIIDTANSCFSIKDENSNAEAAEIVSFLQVARPVRAAVILMKHEREPREGVGKSVRGAKYWLGAVDQVVYLHRQPGRPSERFHKTRLVPAKHRAFGLDGIINISVEELQTHDGKALIFKHSN